jgi:two-component system cell cycle sensor histidine kinase PleC
MTLNEEPVDLLAVMRDVVRLEQGRAAAAAVIVKLSLPATLPDLTADGGKVKRMLSDLLTTAIDSTPQGGWIVVTAERNSRGGLTVAVADTGRGISPGQVTMVKSLIELHGGTFQLNSRDGGGATVSLNFPSGRVGSGAAGGVP